MGLRRVDLPRPGMTQESVSGQMGSSVLGYVVHPCREVYLFEYRVHGNGRSDLYLDLIQLEMDT